MCVQNLHLDVSRLMLKQVWAKPLRGCAEARQGEDEFSIRRFQNRYGFARPREKLCCKKDGCKNIYRNIKLV